MIKEIETLQKRSKLDKAMNLRYLKLREKHEIERIEHENKCKSREEILK
jgi:hypothetical protein